MLEKQPLIELLDICPIYQWTTPPREVAGTKSQNKERIGRGIMLVAFGLIIYYYLWKNLDDKNWTGYFSYSYGRSWVIRTIECLFLSSFDPLKHFLTVAVWSSWPTLIWFAKNGWKEEEHFTGIKNDKYLLKESEVYLF